MVKLTKITAAGLFRVSGTFPGAKGRDAGNSEYFLNLWASFLSRGALCIMMCRQNPKRGKVRMTIEIKEKA